MLFVPLGHKGDLTMAPLRALRLFVNTSKSTSASKRRFYILNFLPTAESPVVFTAIIERPRSNPIIPNVIFVTSLHKNVMPYYGGHDFSEENSPPYE